jgi:RNA polymerase sigma factor (sigma-70 family)
MAMTRQDVLVVDDDPMVLDAVRMMLEIGSISSAASGSREDATAMASARYFPVIVADLRLSTEEEGLQLLDDLRRLAPRSRVVCMTGCATPNIVAEALSRGALHVFQKLDMIDGFVAAVAELLAGIEQEAPAAEETPLDLEKLYLSARRLMHSIPMRRYGFSREEAEDVVQEAWLLFLERRQSVRLPGPWLTGTVANLCRTHISRWRGRAIQGDDLFAGVADERGRGLTDVLDVRKALDQLDPKARRLCTLIAIEGHSYEEASSITGYAAGAIGPLYIRAKKKLREALAA